LSLDLLLSVETNRNKITERSLICFVCWTIDI